MNQQRIDEIKARCDKAIRDEYPEKVYGSAAYYLITSDVPELLTEVERLQTKNAKLQEKQTAKATEHFPQGLGRYDLNVPACPCCKKIIVGKPNYCPNCGQALKWEE
jgi:hypothetical protein